MAPTLEDVMNFMMKDKEERAEERVRDKQEIKELITNGVKAEVVAAKQPMQERQLQVETAQGDMLKQFKGMMEEVKDLKEKINDNTNQSFPSMPQARQPAFTQWGSLGGHQIVAQSDQLGSGCKDHEARIKEIIDLARRTVGLDRIGKDDLVRMRQEQYGGAKTEGEEMMLAVQEYIKCELKMDSDTLERMEVENIFSEDSECLFVTFRHGASVARIFEKTRIMRRGSRIINYIPKEFKDRARGISDIEYKLRLEEKYQTRVKMGWTDLELSKKVRGSGRWERVILPEGLPTVNLSSSPDSG